MGNNTINFKSGEYSDFNKIENPDDGTVYFTENPNHIFKGSKLFTGATRGVTRLTASQFRDMQVNETLNLEGWYFVTDLDGNLKRIYAGDTLVMRASSQGSTSFPYTFPITFTT